MVRLAMQEGRGARHQEEVQNTAFCLADISRMQPSVFLSRLPRIRAFACWEWPLPGNVAIARHSTASDNHCRKMALMLTPANSQHPPMCLQHLQPPHYHVHKVRMLLQAFRYWHQLHRIVAPDALTTSH